MISEVITICKLLLVNPATSATGERSFSTARRIKTWLRANISQKRFTHLAILNTHKTRTDNLRIVDVANVFASRNENRKRKFGIFTEQDLLYNQVKSPEWWEKNYEEIFEHSIEAESLLVLLNNYFNLF